MSNRTWFFSGRRFVATRELKALRYPDPSPLLDANDRMLPSRVQAHAGFYRHRFTVSRDADELW